MAGLLVSVRSASEARIAVAGGAALIDVKEPDRGPLGCADVQVWREVRRTVPSDLPVSVALGEMEEWQARDERRPQPAAESFAGLTYRKLGLAGAGWRSDWERAWTELRHDWGPGPAWIAVVYADWARAEAPHPDAVRDAALADDDCAGILVDTWDKSRPSPLADDARWRRWFAKLRQGRPLLVALAGGLDCAAIERLAPLEPDYFAVRGAVCAGGNRRATIDRARVAELAALLTSREGTGSHRR
jgi:uncharacterized protein (UPF0264 family)